MTTKRATLLRSPVVGLVAALVAALVTVMALTPLLAFAADRVAFVIRDGRVTESSGLARDVDQKIFWTVNDSGSEGTVYGLTAKGDVQGVLGFRVQPTDVEAVALHDDRLYVADIGDNFRARDTISVYYFSDARPDNRTRPYRSYDFAYPDGPHDAETLLVDGNGRLYVVTKELRGGIYAAPEKPSRQGVNRLRRVADAPAFVTDGVFLPDSDRIVLRTYVSLVLIDGQTYQTQARDATPWQRQGESIAVTLDGKSLLLGSEGKNSSVLQVAVPAKLGAAPVAGSAAPASPAPTPTPEAAEEDPAEDESAEDTDPSANRTGTLVALGLAALVSLAAGVLVAARRR
ncbi:MAG TPA: hypothetical protein VEQ66_01005 [Propionibacteriaceae bacterium]|nr:hypothetical protein [Propionibacteriaceae bacterium]